MGRLEDHAKLVSVLRTRSERLSSVSARGMVDQNEWKIISSKQLTKSIQPFSTSETKDNGFTGERVWREGVESGLSRC